MINVDPMPHPWHTLTRTGKPLVLRELTPDDTSALAEFFAGLSPTSTYHRFLSGSRTSSQHYLDSLVSPDQTLCALLALEDQRIVAVASLHPGRTGSAEVAIAVSDDAQGDGIGTLLLEHLARRAKEHGLAQLTALVLADNQPMLDVFGQLGLVRSVSLPSQGEVDVVVDLSTSDGYEERVAARAATARAAAVARAGDPRTICIVHDLRHAKLADLVAQNTRAAGFAGRLTEVRWPAPAPNGTDVAAILTSPLIAEAAVRQCATSGVAAVVWPSRLRTREEVIRRVVDTARGCGVRLCGLPLGSDAQSGDVMGALRSGLVGTGHERADIVLGDAMAVSAASDEGVLGPNRFAPITEQASRRLQFVVPAAALRRGCLTWRKAPVAELSSALDTIADCPEVHRILVALDHPLTRVDQRRVRKIVAVARGSLRKTSVEVRVSGSAGWVSAAARAARRIKA
ncbi:MAG: GNAT family N-acetyltransferase [Nostocoides sp.]